MSRICLITPHHVSFQPRALREADTLHEAGHDVRVVCRHSDQEMTESDRRLMLTKGWRLQAVDLRRNGPEHRSWLVESLRSKFYEQLFNAGVHTPKVISRCYVRGFARLVSLAASEPADWFIAHTQAALPIAAEAARRHRARLGFDCEDLLAEDGTDPSNVVRLIEQIYLPSCDYVTTPSPGIGQHLSRAYGIRAPVVLYNVFPLSLADSIQPPAERSYSSVLRLHWFGQTIGPERGIEEAVKAVGLLNGKAELHLRGRVSEQYRATLESLAQSCGAIGQPVFHPLVDHQNLIKAIGEFDAGLASEQPNRKNYSLTVTNKIFSYLLPGLAIAATDTPGQREVLDQVPSGGFLWPAGDPSALAAGLRRWIEDHNTLRRVQQASWDAARTRFCWDREKDKLLLTMGLIERVPARLQQKVS